MPACEPPWPMTWIARAAVMLTLVASGVALATSIVPGVLNDLELVALLVGMAMTPFVGLALLVAAFVLFRSGHWRSMRKFVPHALAVLAIAFGSYLLLKLYVPRRIAFAMNQSRFEQRLRDFERGVTTKKNAVTRAGIFRIDQTEADPRGGVYFRVFQGQDGLSPDTMSYGFVYQPNHEGSPFGAAHYLTRRLQGDWFWFRASDDSF